MPWLGKCRWCRFELTTYKYDSDLCTQNLKPPQAQRLGPFSWLGKYCIRHFRVASSAYSFNFSTDILCPSIITLSSYHTKASKRSNHLILLNSPPRSKNSSPYSRHHASPASSTHRPSGFGTPRFKSSPKQRGHSKTKHNSSSSR